MIRTTHYYHLGIHRDMTTPNFNARLQKRGSNPLLTTTKNECHNVMPLSCGILHHQKQLLLILILLLSAVCCVIYSLQLQYITKYADSSVDLYLTSQYLHTLT